VRVIGIIPTTIYVEACVTVTLDVSRISNCQITNISYIVLHSDAKGYCRIKLFNNKDVLLLFCLFSPAQCVSWTHLYEHSFVSWFSSFYSLAGWKLGGENTKGWGGRGWRSVRGSLNASKECHWINSPSLFWTLLSLSKQISMTMPFILNSKKCCLFRFLHHPFYLLYIYIYIYIYKVYCLPIVCKIFHLGSYSSKIFRIILICCNLL